MDQPDVDLVRDRFDLGPVTGCTPIVTGGTDRAAWRIDGAGGSFFVKAAGVGSQYEEFIAGQRFELMAHRAGLAGPRPIPTRDGTTAVRIGDQVLTVHEWIDGLRPWTADDVADDVADWLGRTVAHMATLQPAVDVAAFLYRLPDPAGWAELAERGRRASEPWASVLEQRLPLLERIVDGINHAIRTRGPVAVMHPDIEPQNVLIGRDGPLLVDWSFSAPDSVPLVAGHAALLFAMRDGRPDPDLLHSTITAYREAGGRPLGTGSGLLARRAAMLLNRLVERLQTCLGRNTGLDADTARATAQIRLTDLPVYIDDFARWEELLPRD